MRAPAGGCPPALCLRDSHAGRRDECRLRGHHRGMGRRALAMGLLGVLALGACSAGSPSRPEPTPTVRPVPADVLAGLSVEMRQARSDWALRVVQIRVTNA